MRIDAGLSKVEFAEEVGNVWFNPEDGDKTGSPMVWWGPAYELGLISDPAILFINALLLSLGIPVPVKLDRFRL